VCDECGARLDHRSDDTPETVRHRLEVYREMTEPLVRYYEKGDAPVLRVDGDRAPEAVRKALWQALVENLDVDAA
jgi:adenylate kinase